MSVAANPFSRPLRIGDAEQAQAIRVMNGPDLYCPVCFYVPAEHGERAWLGQSCPRCSLGHYVWGGASDHAKREAAEPGKESDDD